MEGDLSKDDAKVFWEQYLSADNPSIPVPSLEFNVYNVFGGHMFHLKLNHISTKLFHFVVVDVEDRSRTLSLLFLPLIYEGYTYCTIFQHSYFIFSCRCVGVAPMLHLFYFSHLLRMPSITSRCSILQLI